jgi:GDP-L-fucose synthase
MTKKKILIIGGTGFVGEMLTMYLKKNFKVYSESRKTNLDLLKIKSYEKKLKKINPQIIINCAAHVGSVHYGIKKPADILIDNLQICMNIYKGLSNCGVNAKVINLLANCSYDGGASIQKEKNWLDGTPHETALSFGSSRRMIYLIAKTFKQQFKIKTYNILLPGLYGPGDHADLNKVHALDGIIIRMLQNIKNNKKRFEIWGTGKPKREWCYIYDVGKLIKKIIVSKKERIYPINFGQKKGYSIIEIAKKTSNILKYKFDFFYNRKFADGAAIKILCNKKFKKEFPNFKFTKIDLGIEETLKYYKKII